MKINRNFSQFIVCGTKMRPPRGLHSGIVQRHYDRGEPVVKDEFLDSVSARNNTLERFFSRCASSE